MNRVEVHNALSSNNGFLSSRLDFDGEWSKSSDDSKFGVTSSSKDCCKLSSSSCGDPESVFLGESLTVCKVVSQCSEGIILQGKTGGTGMWLARAANNGRLHTKISPLLEVR